MTILSHFRRKAMIGIDLGTAHTRVVAPSRGVVFEEPSVCCFMAYDAAPACFAAGLEAHRYIGKVSRPLKIVTPLRNGVVSDMAAARELLLHARRALRPIVKLARPKPVIGVPADATQAERRALAAATVDAGFDEPELIAEPHLAALGLDWDLDEPRGRMVVDCGAGTTEVAVLSLGGICMSRSLRGGSFGLEQALIDHLHFRYRFNVGPASAEKLKRELSERLATGGTESIIRIAGLDMASGLPKILPVPTSELLPVWSKHVEGILRTISAVLRDMPPELAHDVSENGITLTGGAATTALLADRITERTGVHTIIDENSADSVARGLQRILERGRLN